jgi:hypothetical protein
MVGDCGLIATETNVTGFTTSVADPLTEPEVTLIVVVPALRVLASPAVTAVSLMVATAAAVEVQCALRVRLCMVPSENVPVAANGCVVPRAIAADDGLMAMETSVADVTVRTLEPFTEPQVAEMLAVPCAALVAKPAALIVAVAGVSDDQFAVLVRFCVLPSVYVPVAMNCAFVPGAIDDVAGVTAIDTSVAAVTARVADPLVEPDVAVIVVDPCAMLVASPIVEVMVATVGVLELHCTTPVMFCVLPLLNVPVAVNCCGTPSGSVGIAGVTASETSVAAVTVTFAEPLIEPEFAVTPALPTATLLATP